MSLRAILLILIMAIALSLSQAHAENHERDHYREDVVDPDGKGIRIKIDSDNGKVAFFWDNASQRWVDAGLSPVDLNRAYTDQITAQDMQDELNRMKSNTWDDRYGR